MVGPEKKRYLKRVALLAAGLYVLLFCLAVLLYVTEQPWKGFYVYSGQTVASVARDSSAEEKGIKAGDLILQIGDEKITDALDVVRINKTLTIGEQVKVLYLRDGINQPAAVVNIIRTPFPLKLLFWMICSSIIITSAFVFHYRRSEDVPTMLFYLMCVLFCLTFMGAFSWHVIAGKLELLLAFAIPAALLAPVTLHFFFVYPQTSPLLKRVPFVTTLIYIPSCVYMLLMGWMLMRVAGAQGSTDIEPGAVRHLLETVQMLVLYHLGVTFVYCMASLLSLGYCQRTTLLVDVKNQIKWIWWGVVAAAIPLIMLGALLAEGIAPYIFGQLQFWAMLAMLAVLVATGLSIVKFRLMKVDSILNRSVAYVVVSFLMMVIYLAAVGIAWLILSTFTGEVRRLPALISVLALVLFFRPVSDWVQGVINRRFYRERYEFQQAVLKTSQAIGRILDLDLLLRELMDTLMDSLHVKRGAVLLWDTAERRVTVAVARGYLEPESQLTLNWEDPFFAHVVGVRKPVTTRQLHERNWTTGEFEEIISRMVKMHAEVAIPIIHEDEVLGIFVLGRKSSRQIYSSEDVRLLMTLANHAAVAIHNARTYTRMGRLNVELQNHIDKVEEQRHEIMGLQHQLLSENVYLKEEIEAQYNFQDIIGTSPGIQRVLETVKKVAPSTSAVLIRGESGTGKELVARAIHYNSPRSEKAFVRVNCAVLTESLLESELFGHTKGSFTGAISDRAGRFEVADGGTIFLDEIGDVSPRTQVKLLRVLQEKEFERVGSNETHSVNVRVITATNRNLETAMREGHFREDLFYRLNVISIEVPPLRERREDIFPLAIHFLNKYAKSAGKSIRSISPDVLELFKRYRWPGNVRELENLIERAVVLADGHELTVSDFPIEVDQYAGDAPEDANGLTDQLEAMERDSIRKALRNAGGNKSRAAKELGLPRSTLISKLKKWDLA